MSRSTKPVRQALEDALRRIPEDGLVLTRVEVERLAAAFGSFVRLSEVINGPDNVTVEPGSREFWSMGPP